MEDVAAANGTRPRAARNVVDLANLNRRDVSIFSETGRHEPDRTPPIRANGRNRDLRRLHDEVRFAKHPLIIVVRELERGRHVCGITERGAVVRPSCNLADFLVAQRRVVFEFLDADGLLHVPRRHHAAPRPDAGPRFHRASPRPGVFVGKKRHRSSAVRAVTRLATPLQDRRDVFREGDITCRVRGRSSLRVGGHTGEKSQTSWGQPHESVGTHRTLPL